jgi:hypothetical protein
MSDSIAINSIPKANAGTNKRSIIVALSVCALLLAFYAIYRNIFLVATVNGSPITRFSLIRELETSGGHYVLEQLIVAKLIDTEVQNAGIVVSSSEIEADIDIYKARLRFQGATLQDVLIQLGPKGMTEDAFRQQTAQRLRFWKYLEKILGEKVRITDAEIDSEMRESKQFKEMSPADARIQVKTMLQGRRLAIEGNKWLAEARSKADVKVNVKFPSSNPRYLP